MKNVLLDTDVLLDFFFNREPHSGFTAQVLNLCQANKLKGVTTPVIISNTYYLLRKTANHKMVIEKLKQLLTIIDVLKIDKAIVVDALNSSFTDFEDALQNFSAIRNGRIDIILTRNIKDYRKSDLAVMTPETYLKIINIH